MKLQLTILSILASAIFFTSCSKEVVSRTDNTAALNPANIDINAGTWRPVLLTGPTEFAVTAPAATNTPGYVAGSKISAENKKIILTIGEPVLCFAGMKL